MSLREHVQSKEDPNVSGRPDLIKRWDKITREQKQAKAEWIKTLIGLGIKAAHPDDGWVDRTENYVDFCYPHFNFKPKVGDLICLGSHYDDDNRIVQVIRKKTGGIIRPSTKYYFKELSKGKL